MTNTMNLTEEMQELRKTRIKGLKTFDTSLPQPWFDCVIAKTNVSPFGHIVWCYDDTPDWS